MQKLKLDLDDLTVKSFETVEDAAGRGTVQGHDVPTATWCAANSYPSWCPNTLCTCPPPRD